MSADIFKTASEMAREGRYFAVATVIRVEGSSSAPPGSKAIIDVRGKLVAGWIGGGCAESAVRRCALECFESRRPRLIRLDLTDEVLGVGMPCGGIMDVYVEPVLPKPQLLIVGYGRIAEALSKIGALLDFSVTVDHPGAESADFPANTHLITGDYDLSEAPIGSDTFIVIVTQHKGDHIFLRRALSSEAPYIALVASRHRANLILEYLTSTGATTADLERVWAPAGLDIGSATPEEIALSVMSQIVAQRRRGSGRPLKHEPGTATDDAIADLVISECEIAGSYEPRP
jgi:xanthine dehydrogenase accessory factor